MVSVFCLLLVMSLFFGQGHQRVKIRTREFDRTASSIKGIYPHEHEHEGQIQKKRYNA